MTRLWWLNFCLLQWCWLRLARIVDTDTDKHMGWTVLVGVVPLTGWWGRYVRAWRWQAQVGSVERWLDRWMLG
jgi:hypothetical protein